MSSGSLAIPLFPGRLADLLSGLSAMATEPPGAEAERDAQEVAAARADPMAFRHLVDRYQGRVYATCLRMLGNPSEAEDAAQEAFLRAYRALHRFEAGRRFGPWVCAIAANVARDQLRSPLRRLERMGLLFSRDRTPGSPAHEPRAAPPMDLVEVGEDRDRLADALLGLKPRLREALVLRFVSDLSVEEVAEALGIGTSAAKMRLKRGLDQLRAALDDEGAAGGSASPDRDAGPDSD